MNVADYIETAKGNRFYLSHPEFDIEEIAHALSQQCRFAGHCARFYSVAEHSVLVSRLMDAPALALPDPFEGLMHDASEAYLCDIAAPWKALLPDYKRIEGELEEKLRARFGLPLKMTDGCKRADWLALFIEAHWLLPTGAKDWPAPAGIKEQAAELIAAHWMPICYSPGEAKRRFLDHFERLHS